MINWVKEGLASIPAFPHGEVGFTRHVTKEIPILCKSILYNLRMRNTGDKPLGPDDKWLIV